jgi:RNA polymerase sigma-70 factor (ECF subfamily)
VGVLHPKVDPHRRLAANGAAAVGRSHPAASPASNSCISPRELADALRLVARGDQAALRSLYAATSVKLFGVILRILGRADLAEDVLQDVYIRVWQRAGEFDPAAVSPMAWLVTIARNRALDENRRTTARSADDCPDPFQANGSAVHADGEEDKEQARLLACLDRLGPDMKEVVVLAYHYGMSREEIARRTNRPVATVQTWLRQGLAQIKDSLGE